MLNVESKTLTEIEIKAIYQKFRATQKKLTAATLELKKRFEEFHEELGILHSRFTLSAGSPLNFTI